MLEDDTRSDLKHWAISIVSEVEPDDVFVIQDGFDALLDDWDRAEAPDEGRFSGAAEVVSFAGLVVPFLLAFVRDLAKDVVKDQAKKGLTALIDKVLARKATTDEAEKLKTAIESAIANSKFSKTQKDNLSAGFQALFEKMRQDP